MDIFALFALCIFGGNHLELDYTLLEITQLYNSASIS